MKKNIVVVLCVCLLITLAACNDASESQSVSQSEINVEDSQETTQSSETVDSGEVPEFAKAIDDIRAEEDVEAFMGIASAFSLEEDGYRLLLDNPDTHDRMGFILSEEEMSELIIYIIDHANGTLEQVHFDDISSSLTSHINQKYYYYHIDDKLIMMVPQSDFYDNDTMNN